MIRSTKSQPTNLRVFKNRTKKTKCQIFHCLIWLAILAMGCFVLLTVNVHQRIDQEEVPRTVHYTVMQNGKRTILPQRKYAKVIYFLHIHKSAGSFLCKQAYQNRVSAPYETNCNAQKDQYCCGPKDSIASQIDFANETHYDFVATEREMYDAMVPSSYDYVVSLRQSKARYYSHYLHVVRLAKKEAGISKLDSLWLWNGPNGDASGDHPMVRIRREQARQRIRQQQRKKRKEQLAQNSEVALPLKDFATWSAGQPDNWNVRIICGRKCKSSAKFQISRKHFEYTLGRLAKFRHIIFVEEMVASFNNFAADYDWKPRTKEENSNTMRENRKKRNYTLADVEQAPWNPMMSALDDALYAFAKKKYNNETKYKQWAEFSNQQHVDEYFKLGTKQQCSDICCGDCTPY